MSAGRSQVSAALAAVDHDAINTSTPNSFAETLREPIVMNTLSATSSLTVVRQPHSALA
jgi:hypothetical protein